jgi:hypothetical protein
MAAGQGFKTFTTGEVLTAGDVNGYLMQGVLVFASAAARNAAITSPQEGQFAFTKDTNGLWYYDGAAWVASGATGDIEGVTAGVGISGGGTSGTVTITNSMATAIDAKGDLVAGTGADTFAKLTVGANNTVLTADSAEATGLKWAAAASGGGMTVISSGNLTGSAISVSGITGYKNIQVVLRNYYPSVGGESAYFRLNGNTTSIYTYSMIKGTSTAIDNTIATSVFGLDDNLTSPKNASNGNSVVFNVYDIASTTGVKLVSWQNRYIDNPSNAKKFTANFGYWDSTSAVTEVNINMGGGANFDGGTYIVYGVN